MCAATTATRHRSRARSFRAVGAPRQFSPTDPARYVGTVRHTSEQLDTWRRDGGVILDSFFTTEELAPCVDGMEALYGHLRPDDPSAHENFDARTRYIQQFANTTDLPFHANPELNLLGLHPALIACAREALGTDDVRMYQCHTWAKFTGQTDFDQPFHCDYKNHTLTVPGEDAVDRTINFMIYLTDVTDEHGAIHYVPVPESDPITGPMRPQFAGEAAGYEEQLRAIERSGAAPAGSIFAYGIDVFHRGTNLTAPDGFRYTITASYKAAGNDQIGWSAWPRYFREPWHLVMDHATVEQRTCLGIPAPGDPFWTDLTVARTTERWPNADWSEYETALAV